MMRWYVIALLFVLFLPEAWATFTCDNTSSLPVVVEDVSHAHGELVFLERGWTLAPKIKISATDYVSDVEVHAFIFGYDHHPIGDTLKVFDMDPGVTYFKRFSIPIPQDIDPDLYKVRYVIADRNGASVTCYADYSVGSRRHEVLFRDTVFPAIVEAGSYLDARVAVKNYGQKDEDGIKVTAAIPWLNTSTSLFIDSLDHEDEVPVEGLYLWIPPCTPSGNYRLWITTSYNEMTESHTDTYLVQIVGDRCRAAAKNIPYKTVSQIEPALLKNVMQPPKPVQDNAEYQFVFFNVLIALAIILLVVVIILSVAVWVKR